MKFAHKAILSVAVFGAALGSFVATPARAQVVFQNNLDGTIPAQFSGVVTQNNVYGQLDGVGVPGNTFSGKYLENSSGGTPQGTAGSFTTLTLTGLGAHDRVNIGFLLGLIGSWDGANSPFGPDFFNVRVDGASVFSQTFAVNSGTQTYVGDKLSIPGSPSGLAAYNMFAESSLQNIAHTGSTLTIDWFANGAGWQGGNDELFAIDNVQVSLVRSNSAIPEPGTAALAAAAGLPMVGMVLRRRRRK